MTSPEGPRATAAAAVPDTARPSAPPDPARAPDPAWAREAAAPIGLMEAMRLARAAAAELSGLPVDGIAASARTPEGGWRIVVDVIESPARMGENDLLSAQELLFAPDGALEGYARLNRYRREGGTGQ